MAVIMDCALLAVGHNGAVTQPAGMTSSPVMGGRSVDVAVGISTVLHFTEKIIGGVPPRPSVFALTHTIFFVHGPIT